MTDNRDIWWALSQASHAVVRAVARELGGRARLESVLATLPGPCMSLDTEARALAAIVATMANGDGGVPELANIVMPEYPLAGSEPEVRAAGAAGEPSWVLRNKLLLAVLMVLAIALAEPAINAAMSPELRHLLALEHGPLAYGLAIVATIAGVAAVTGKKD